jgi:hypothetical protein
MFGCGMTDARHCSDFIAERNAENGRAHAGLRHARSFTATLAFHPPDWT